MMNIGKEGSMKKTNLILITSILVVVLLIVEIVIVRAVSKYQPQISVVYAKTSIAENTVVDAEMLMEKKTDAGFVHRLSVVDINDIIGKKTIAGIEQGEMILSSRLGEVGETERINVVDKNNRLFAVEFKGDQANGWWLKPDQFVDIIFVPNEKNKNITPSQDIPQNGEEKSNEEGISENWKMGMRKLENIRIAAVISDKGVLLEHSEKTTLPRYISFEITDEQCEFLSYAKGAGRIEVCVIP